MVEHSIEIANKCLANNEKIVIACNFDDEINSLKEYFGDKCVVLNGKMNSTQKEESVERFMEDPNVMVFLGNIEAAGVGITLTSSRVLLFNSFHWSPAMNIQMCDRVHRISQTRKVHIYRQYFNNTQSVKMKEKLENKEYVINTVIKKEDEK